VGSPFPSLDSFDSFDPRFLHACLPWPFDPLLLRLANVIPHRSGRHWASIPQISALRVAARTQAMCTFVVGFSVDRCRICARGSRVLAAAWPQSDRWAIT
jgi:hypothetical protein